MKHDTDCRICHRNPGDPALAMWCAECDSDYMAQEMPPEAMAEPDEITRVELLSRFPWIVSGAALPERPLPF